MGLLLAFVVVLLAGCQVNSQCTTSLCDGRQDSSILTMLDTIYHSIINVMTRVLDLPSASQKTPQNCGDIQSLGYTTSAIYTVYYLEGNVWSPVRVYCDMETAGGGWLVFQRRLDGEEDFYRNWKNYTDGFGDLDKEFWLGNYYLHMLTSGGKYRLRIDLEDFEGEKRYAEYSSFSVGGARDNFILSVSGYSGDAGDSFGHHNGYAFSTKDRDHDKWTKNCADDFKGAWWYISCHRSNLNGAYLAGNHTSFADGVDWSSWRGLYYSLKSTEMKFKPA